MAAEAVRDYSDTALMLYGVRLDSVSFLLLGTKLPSRVSGARLGTTPGTQHKRIC